MARRPQRLATQQPYAHDMEMRDNISPARSTTSQSSESDRLQRDPFATPNASQYPSRNPSPMPMNEKTRQGPRYFQSRRIKKENIDKPWLTDTKDKRKKWLTIIPLIGIVIGLGLGGYMVYNGLQSVPKHTYCSVYDEDWSSGALNRKVWTNEVEVGGYGNGQFEETTNTDENAFVEGGMLHIKPTLQDAALLENGKSLNLTKQGICTSTVWSNCYATTNTTNGTIINPVKSARINTKKGAVIKYGRIEVEALMPDGDWLWPAIWMLPVNETYGPWPQSGEIDIMESRGNNYTYPLGGNNIMSSTLHWGPDVTNDAWWRTYGKQRALQTTFSKTWHTFGLEWSEKYLYTYLDGRLLQVLYTNFNKPMWQRGHFPLQSANGTAYVDEWADTGRDQTPFDQDFYLILNVAVGGTNGWFVDGKAGKPWVDGSPTAQRDFWNAKDQWYPTWQKGSGGAEMLVKSVKMWQQQGYNGC